MTKDMTKNVQLTQNFWLDEYFKDSDNQETVDRLFNECVDFQVTLSHDLAVDQQKMRDFINEHLDADGKITITNTSGYRDPDLNAAQPGAAEKSLHPKLRAVDFKTADPAHLKLIYTFITVFSDLVFRECFIYVTVGGIATNIHYAKRAPGFIGRRFGIYVRPAEGGNPVRLDRYLKTITDEEGATFTERLGMK